MRRFGSVMSMIEPQVPQARVSVRPLARTVKALPQPGHWKDSARMPVSGSQPTGAIVRNRLNLRSSKRTCSPTNTSGGFSL